MLRRVHAERAVGLNYGQRALMIGAAHPVNFIGTQANTRSGRAAVHAPRAHREDLRDDLLRHPRRGRPGARLRRRACTDGFAASSPRPPARGRRARSYSAFDPPLMLWTVAVIADSAEAFFETFVRRLSMAEKDALWRDYVRFGELFGMPREAAPASYPRVPRLLGGDVGRRTSCTSPTRRARSRSRSPSRSRCRATCTLSARCTTWSSPARCPPRVREMFGLRWTSVPRGRVPRPSSPRHARRAAGDPAQRSAAAPTPPRSSWSPRPRSGWSPRARRRCRLRADRLIDAA